MDKQAAYAQPTLEFASGIEPVSHFETFSNVAFPLQYDSEGASSCIRQEFVNNVTTSYLSNAPVRYTWPVSTRPAGQYRWTLDCATAYGVRSTAQATAYVKRAVTRVAWLINTTSTGGWREFTGTPSPSSTSFTWSAGAPMYQRYESVGADSCVVTSSGASWDGWSETVLWNSGQYPASHDFGVFYLGDPRTAAPPMGPYGKYKWHVECRNAEGSSLSATVYGAQSP